MRLHFFIIALLLSAVNLFCVVTALAEPMLKAINRSDEPGHLQLFFHFDQLPGYQFTTNGRRVDLILTGVTMADNLTPPASDDRMIKMVTKTEGPTTTLSFYFRYPPQKVHAEGNKETGLIMLDTLLGNRLSASYPELTTRLHGVTVVKRAQPDTFNPVSITPYATDWRSFFTGFESPVDLSPPPRLHLPPFPLAVLLSPEPEVSEWLPEEINNLVDSGKWLQVCLLLRQQVEKTADEHIKERLVLSYAEGLVRAGEYREPYFLLQRITLGYPDSLLADLASFLLIYQQADRGDHTNAYYELRTLLGRLGTTRFAPDFNLLLAELALMANRTSEAQALLDDPIVAQEPSLALARRMRQADLLFTGKQTDNALAAYLELAAQSALIETDPLSLAQFAQGLYEARRYPEAAKRYQQLVDLLANRPGMDLALFRLAMCHLRIPASVKKARTDLIQIQNAFPDTLGGERAHLKQTDLDYTSKRMKGRDAEAVYGKYALSGKTVGLREESGFKQALVNSLEGEAETSVRQCMHLLRTFQSGTLRTEATALLIQQLPGVIRQLVKDDEYVKSLVLAKQNKNLFVRGWLETDLLYDLARAYSRLGMADETAQTYQYLFEVSGEADRENIYLPLLQAFMATGRFTQVGEYADRYQIRYPKGRDTQAVFALKVRALYDSGQLDQALALLTSSSGPMSRELDLLKGRILFEKKEWQKVIDTLAQPGIQESLASHALVLPLAESYFQAGKEEQAAPLFRQLLEGQEQVEQARFRLAQIALNRGDRAQALNLFKELAEKGTDPLWKKIAQEKVAILEITNQ